MKSNINIEHSLISVIIPVYNVDKYIYECFESVSNQTYSNIEIILVDDGSTDLSGSICDKLANEDNRAKVYHKRNGGLSDARNFGITKSKGDYLFFLDSDDYIEKDCLETLLYSIKENNSDIAVTNFIPFTDKGLDKKNSFIKSERCFNSVTALLEIMYANEMTWSACGKLFKSDLFKDLRFPVGKFWEDLQCIPWVLSRANYVSLIKEKMYYYRYNVDSITKQNISLAKIKDWYEAINKTFKFISNNYTTLNKAAFVMKVIESINMYKKLMDSNLLDDATFKKYSDLAKKNIIYYRRKIIFDKKINKFSWSICFLSFFMDLGYVFIFVDKLVDLKRKL